MVRTRAPGKDALDFVITLMLAFPGMAVGVSYLLAFWKGIPLATHWIIMPLALFARRLPYFLRMAHSSYLQLDSSLEEASEVSGAGKFRTFVYISLPLLLKGVLVGRDHVFHHGIPGDFNRHLPLPGRLGDVAHRDLSELAPRHGVRHRRSHGLFDDRHHLHPFA